MAPKPCREGFHIFHATVEEEGDTCCAKCGLPYSEYEQRPPDSDPDADAA